MELERKFRIHTYEADTEGRMSPPSLFNYLQDIAAAHADALNWGKEELMKKKQFWVLSRMAAEMESIPGGGSEIVIRTWPRGVDGIFAMRDFDIRDSSGKLIGGATSAWLILDAVTRRPVRPGSILSETGDIFPERQSLGRNPVKLPAPGEGRYNTLPFPVRYSDLDVNLHVNNVKYLQWALDAYPLDFRMNNEIRGVEANYMSESLPGDEVSISISEEEDAGGNHSREGISELGHSEEGYSGAGHSGKGDSAKGDSGENESRNFLHSVKRSGDNRELCRIRVRWVERKTDKVY
ncbi:MAG: acyl-[acyl-carrier-protein] thioesterase [Bacteroidales bacterium]